MGKQEEKPRVETQESAAPRRRSRKWPWVLVGVLIVLILIVLLIPVALSSQRFTHWLQAKISSSTGGQADIGNLSVGWFRGVRVADFSFRGENGWEQVNVDRITTQPNFAGLLTGNLGLDRTVLDQPRVAIDLRNRPAPDPNEQPTAVDMNDLARLNDVAGANGVGRVDMVENRFVGMKSRGVYETPGGTVLYAAHRAVESITMDREVMLQRDLLSPKIAQLIYNGFWYSPEMKALMAFVDASQQDVTGTAQIGRASCRERG